MCVSITWVKMRRQPQRRSKRRSRKSSQSQRLLLRNISETDYEFAFVTRKFAALLLPP
ncbi:MAG: hypothetical protein JWO52_6941 [Gammaproteobacteria bacterium]|jgi:hypothetical protein|nr:hypothetical protein [Gammaproteobacteria bacterium]